MREERKQRGNKFKVRFGTVRGLKRRELLEIFKSAEVKYESIKEQSNGFLVKCEDEREAQQAIDLDGALVGTQTLRVTKSVLPGKPCRHPQPNHFGNQSPECPSRNEVFRFEN